MGKVFENEQNERKNLVTIINDYGLLALWSETLEEEERVRFYRVTPRMVNIIFNQCQRERCGPLR